MNNNEFTKLKNSIAIKSVIKIILYSMGAILIFGIIVDGIYNGQLADTVAGFDRTIYY